MKEHQVLKQKADPRSGRTGRVKSHHLSAYPLPAHSCAYKLPNQHLTCYWRVPWLFLPQYSASLKIFCLRFPLQALCSRHCSLQWQQSLLQVNHCNAGNPSSTGSQGICAPWQLSMASPHHPGPLPPYYEFLPVINMPNYLGFILIKHWLQSQDSNIAVASWTCTEPQQ